MRIGFRNDCFFFAILFISVIENITTTNSWMSKMRKSDAKGIKKKNILSKVDATTCVVWLNFLWLLTQKVGEVLELMN